jgi:hypothetical protein
MYNLHLNLISGKNLIAVDKNGKTKKICGG